MACAPHWHHPDEDLGALARRCLSHDPAQRPEFAEILTALGPPAPLAPAARPSSPLPLPATLGMAATIGLKRRGMEDACCVLDRSDARILAVFDGFRGDRIAAFSARALALILADALERSGLERSGDDDAAAIKDAFAHLQARIRRLDPVVTAGSTATVAVLRPGRIGLGWLGDSPACLLGAGGPRDLIHPHHPDDAAEARRIETAGGQIRREMRVMDSGEELPLGAVARPRPGWLGRDCADAGAWPARACRRHQPAAAGGRNPGYPTGPLSDRGQRWRL
ncbi:PP2C family serine/threonine-protein phosphatase [Paracoccus sp. DMF-8]|uniref:PP2C family serine/threonine-protein phosphatase n=1 Tax=Paracoccus sp. DMF-8 TaxID=3019445 RepID=UPI0023E38D37|nr:PP2C family serine/threonine-protein phosphatase [Paracoccus sp. DMF-8]MDF3608491.1 PP2C family serine/threonine-protein phosphatase [Paracoccus sp. DMF-8]